jgi:lysozyme
MSALPAGIVKQRSNAHHQEEHTMEIGTAGLALIEEFEGCVLTAYWDKYGKVWTIGYGTTSSADDGEIREGMQITKQEATDFLRNTINREIIPTLQMAETVRRTKTNRYLNQNQIDALCSIAYNVGPGVLTSSHTLGGDLIKGAPAGRIAQDFLSYDDSGGEVLPGLVRRREAERRLFLSTARPTSA